MNPGRHVFVRMFLLDVLMLAMSGVMRMAAVIIMVRCLVHRSLPLIENGMRAL